MKKVFYGDIDILRAFCFLIVFLFHCHVPGFQLGWSGVCVFFTISGFLITNILIESRKSTTYFTSFYGRRMLRIFPIYYFGILACSAVLYLTGKLADKDVLVYYLTYTQNFLWTFGHDPSMLGSLFAHTWTLAIEEQFYLIWPFILFFTPQKYFETIILSMIGMSIVLRIILTYTTNTVTPIIILLPCQFDCLALGALLALHRQSLTRSIISRQLITHALPAGGILLCIYLIAMGIRYEGGYAGYNAFDHPELYLNMSWGSLIYFIVGLVSVGLIRLCLINTCPRINPVGRFFSHLGKISYGLYFYHWPIIIATEKAAKLMNINSIPPRGGGIPRNSQFHNNLYRCVG